MWLVIDTETFFIMISTLWFENFVLIYQGLYDLNEADWHAIKCLQVLHENFHAGKTDDVYINLIWR